MSPVEQVVTTVNIALRRQLYLLNYFAEGNIPDSLMGCRKPERRSRSHVIRNLGTPFWMAISAAAGGPSSCPAASRKPSSRRRSPTRGPFDEWLARIVSFFLDLAPGSHPPVNRATAETQKELAEEEGLAPILAWAKALIDEF